VDHQIVVVGIACDVPDRTDTDSDEPACVPGTTAAAVLDIRDGRAEWRKVELPSALAAGRMDGARGLGATSDGRAVFMTGRGTYWTFDPRTDAWRQIDGPGVQQKGACLAGDTLVVLSASAPTTVDVGTVASPVIASRDLGRGGSWTSSPPGDGLITTVRGMEITGFSLGLSCTDDGAAVTDSTGPELTRLYSLATRSWSAPPVPPRVSTVLFVDTIWTGDELVFLPSDGDAGRPGLGYRPSTRAWRTLTGIPTWTRGAAWNGAAIVGYSDPHREGPAGTMTDAGVFRYVPTSG
jgi:hypothetical protein